MPTRYLPGIASKVTRVIRQYPVWSVALNCGGEFRCHTVILGETDIGLSTEEELVCAVRCGSEYCPLESSDETT